MRKCFALLAALVLALSLAPTAAFSEPEQTEDTLILDTNGTTRSVNELTVVDYFNNPWNAAEMKFFYSGDPLMPPIYLVDPQTNERVPQYDNFDVTYRNNVNIGTATITLTGKNNLQGTRAVTFSIWPECRVEQFYYGSTGKYLLQYEVAKGFHPDNKIISFKSYDMYIVPDYGFTEGGNTYVTYATVSEEPFNSYSLAEFTPVDPPSGISATIPKPGYSKLAGDVNGNGKVNIVDAQLAYELATNPDWFDLTRSTTRMWLAADANGKNGLDANDAFAIQNAVINGWK